MQNYTITVRFKSEDHDVPPDLKHIIEQVAPYMVDNVDVRLVYHSEVDSE